MFLKLSRFLQDLGEYKASSIVNQVSLESLTFTMSNPSINFDVPEIVYTRL